MGLETAILPGLFNTYRRVQSCRKAVNGNRSLPLVAAGHWGADNACTLSDWKTGDY
jgi:hypothetical protein